MKLFAATPANLELLGTAYDALKEAEAAISDVLTLGAGIWADEKLSSARHKMRTAITKIETGEDA